MENEIMVIEEAMSLTITNEVERDKANSMLRVSKSFQKQIFDLYEPMRIDAEKAKKTILSERDGKLKPYEEAEKILKAKLIKYDNDQETKRREAQEIARKEHEVRMLEEAARLEKAGHTEIANEIVDNPLPFFPAIPDIPKMDGSSFVSEWTFVIEDVAIIPRQYMVPNAAAIGAVVRALKGSANIPGIKVIEKKSMRTRGY